MRAPMHSHAIVEAWFDTLPPGQRLLARELQQPLVDAVPTLTQAVKWGNLLFLHRGTHALALVAHKGHVNLQVFNGALLAPDFTELAGSGKGMRHLKCRVGQAVDALLVQRLARACVEALPDRPALRPSDLTAPI